MLQWFYQLKGGNIMKRSDFSFYALKDDFIETETSI